MHDPLSFVPFGPCYSFTSALFSSVQIRFMYLYGSQLEGNIIISFSKWLNLPHMIFHICIILLQSSCFIHGFKNVIMYINCLSFICSCIWHLGPFYSLAMIKNVVITHDCHIYSQQRLAFLSLFHSKSLYHSLISWGPTCNFCCSLSRWNFIQKVMIYAKILEYSYFFSLSLSILEFLVLN